MTATRVAEGARKKKVIAFFEDVIGRGRYNQLDLIAPDYVSQVPALQGLPILTPGREALAARLREAGPIPHRVYRLVADGDLVYAHVRYDTPEPFSGADIFLFDGHQRIVEHWSARQAIAGDAAKGIDRFEGGGDADAPTTPERREDVRRIANEVFNVWRHADVAQVPRYYDDRYIQHNPDMPGGAQRIREVFETDLKAYIAATGGPFPVDCHRVGVEGDLIFVHYSVFMAGIGRSAGARSTNIDIFRINGDDRMAEHWDILQIEQETPPPPCLLF